MLRFTTLFNYKYLPSGLMMYRSLIRHVPKFKLYIFAFDDITYEYLKKKNFNNIIPISLKDFEDKNLLRVKKKRTSLEYFWTCTGSTILYLFKKKKINDCIYVDADLYFYKNPEKIIRTVKKQSCMITRHNYAPEYNQAKTNGEFCVQFMYFKNNNYGNRILNKWRLDCIKWCYNKVQGGKFGDQKYLDFWPKKFVNHLSICSEVGAGIAPWNSAIYNFLKRKKNILINNDQSNTKCDLFFFHFHELKFYSRFFFYIGAYKINNSCYEIIYKNYIKSYLIILKELKQNKIFKNIIFYSSLGNGRTKIINFLKLLINFRNIRFFLIK